MLSHEWPSDKIIPSPKVIWKKRNRVFAVRHDYWDRFSFFLFLFKFKRISIKSDSNSISFCFLVNKLYILLNGSLFFFLNAENVFQMNMQKWKRRPLTDYNGEFSPLVLWGPRSERKFLLNNICSFLNEKSRTTCWSEKLLRNYRRENSS